MYARRVCENSNTEKLPQSFSMVPIPPASPSKNSALFPKSEQSHNFVCVCFSFVSLLDFRNWIVTLSAILSFFLSKPTDLFLHHHLQSTRIEPDDPPRSVRFAKRHNRTANAKVIFNFNFVCVLLLVRARVTTNSYWVSQPRLRTNQHVTIKQHLKD